MQQQNFSTARNAGDTNSEPTKELLNPVEARPPLIAGYVIGEGMGRGPLGKIYRATHHETGKQVVFRGFTRPEGADATAWEKAKDQFRELLEQHRRIENHPNIQKIVNFGDEDGLFWIATEYFEGRTLHAILEQEGAQRLPWAIAVFRQVAHAADWSGERGLSHTDLTPYNILLVNQPEADSRKIQVKVINFGLAHARKKYGSRYAAPEQMTGSEGDRRADVYAVGALLYETLTGVPLHDGASPELVAAQVKTNKANKLPAVPDQPDFVGKVLSVMLTTDPRMRYASVSEAVDDIDHERAPESFAAQGIVLDDPEEAAKAEKSVRLQDYRLSDQDVVVIQKQRYAARQEAEQELARERRARTVRRYVTAGVAAGLTLLGIHAATLPGQYRRLRVAAISGSPSLMRSGSPSSLFVGQEITDDGTPQIQTGPNDSVTLTTHNAHILIEPNSALTVSELHYNNGGLRRFDLKSGMVLASIAHRERAAIFEIDAATAGGTVRTQIKSGAYAVYADSQANAFSPVTIATLSGKSIAAMGDVVLPLPAGKYATTSAAGIGAEQPLPDGLNTYLTDALRRAANAPGTPTPIAALMNAEERLILPIVEGVKIVANLPGFFNDRKARIVALSSMQFLCAAVNQNAGEDAPNKVNLSTLEPLSFPDKQRILSGFEGGKLTSYRRLPDGGYEFLARADDAAKTLIRGRNGKARIADNDDLEDAGNPLTNLVENAGKAANL